MQGQMDVPKKFPLKQPLIMAAILAVGCVLSVVLDSDAKAKLTKDTAKAAGQAYSNYAISEIGNNTAVRPADSKSAKTRMFKRTNRRWRYLEKWNFVNDLTGKYEFSCWLHLALRGDSIKVYITKVKNANPCGDTARKMTFSPASNRLARGHI